MRRRYGPAFPRRYNDILQPATTVAIPKATPPPDKETGPGASEKGRSDAPGASHEGAATPPTPAPPTAPKVGDERRAADLSGHDLDDEQTTLERIYRQTIEDLLTRASALGPAAPASLPSREPARRAGQAPGPPIRPRDRAPQGPETPSAAAPSPEAPTPGQPWRKPPETASDLANLRALANRHTRQTFDADMRQLALSACRKLWSALAMILLSQLLFWLSVPVPSLGLGLALATLLVGILWTLQYYRLTGELARKLASRPESDKVGASQDPMQS